MSATARLAYLAQKVIEAEELLQKPIEQFNAIKDMALNGVKNLEDRAQLLIDKLIQKNAGKVEGIEDKIEKIQSRLLSRKEKFEEKLSAAKERAAAIIEDIVNEISNRIKGVKVEVRINTNSNSMSVIVSPELFSYETDFVKNTLISFPETSVTSPTGPLPIITT